ncbi:MAG: hypothetical protein ACLFSW_03260 [Halobacteriales archaeon]
MTRKAVREQFRLVSESVFDDWTGEFRPSRAVGISFVPAPVDSVARFFLGGLSREFAHHREGYERGLKAALDYAEEVGLDGGSFGKYEDEILATDYWYACCDDEGRDALGDALLARYRRIGKEFGPIAGFPEDGFWDAAKGAYDRDETVDALDHLFGYADTLEEHADGVSMEMTVASRNIDYTDEALRSLRSTEERLFERVEAKADEVY